MHRSRLFLPFVGALALAACSADSNSPELLAPKAGARTASVSASANGRYILGSNNGFNGDLASAVASVGGTLESVNADAGIAVVSGLTADAATQLASAAGVSDVQPDAEISLDTPVATDVSEIADAAQEQLQAATPPTPAALYARQWNMRVIEADKAWAAHKTGNSGVTVAILDTGIDYDNSDLSGRVDLSRSVSFIPSDDALAASLHSTRNAIDDYNGHGTNVATQVASNADAFAGVTSQTTLIGVKVLAGWGGGSLSAILNGVIFAADHGADVANMSLGGGFAKAGFGRFVGLINKTFNYASRKGMLIVVAAGNDGADLDHDGNFHADFCAQPHVVCVSATGPASPADDYASPSFYTNYGRSAISVAGPGGNGTVGADGKLVNFQWPWRPKGSLQSASWVYSQCAKSTSAFADKAHNYAFLGLIGCNVPLPAGRWFTLGYIGTSQATPHVAGLAALLVAEKGHGQPSQIKNAIQQSADDLGAKGTDPFYGRGRINVAKALGL